MVILFWVAGGVLAAAGLAGMVWSRSRGRRSALVILCCGLFTLAATALPAPDLAAAEAVRSGLLAELTETAPARRAAIARWDEARAALPVNRRIPARYLRWNTADPVFESNLNLVPAIFHTEGTPAADMAARSTAEAAAEVRRSPVRHIGRILRFEGRVMLHVNVMLDPELARVMGKGGARTTVVLLGLENEERLYFWMLGAHEFELGQSLTVHGYMVGLHEGTPPHGQALVLFGHPPDPE